MKLKYEFVITEIGDEIIAVPVGDEAQEFRGVLKINNTANDIIELLQNDITRDELINKLSEKYEVSNKEIASAVDSFVGKLRENRLLTE